MKNILPCKTCGGAGELLCLSSRPGDTERYLVECRDCEAEGCEAPLPRDAIRLWNTEMLACRGGRAIRDENSAYLPPLSPYSDEFKEESNG